MASAFSDDISIDLGTANTLVHVADRGIIIDEPSIVAVRAHRGGREILAVGRRAAGLIGRTPERLELVRPLRDGVIADFVATEEMLRQFIRRTQSKFGFRGPRILICVPAGATPVERRAVYDTAVSLGARKVFLIAEPVAASLGAGLSAEDRDGAMVLDIGGGTSDIAVLSSGTVREARTLRVGGNALDEAIIRYVRRRYNLMIGETSAERIKVEAGTALSGGQGRGAEVHLRGRDLQSGMVTTAVLSGDDLAEALAEPVDAIGDFVQRTLEELAPELVSDIARGGVAMTGGGALLHDLDVALTRRVGVRFRLQSNPMLCVVRGSAAVLAGLKNHAHLLMAP
jgi:rod shape-determining protein MreB